MRTMLDCAVLPAEIPACDVLAGYITGGSVDHVWSPEDWSRAKAHSAFILPIHVAAFQGSAVSGGAAGHQSVNDAHGLVIGEGCAVCIDIEHADTAHIVESGYAAAWVGVVGSAGFVPLIYASESDRAMVEHLGALWLADWTGEANLIAGTLATQWEGGPGHAFDTSAVADTLKLASTGKQVPPVATPNHSPIVGMASTPDGGGYWECDAEGHVFAFGDAQYLHSPEDPNVPHTAVCAIVAHPGGQGYWLRTVDGGVFGYGQAAFHGAIVNGELREP